MELETKKLKELKKLADACRKAGIDYFKGYGFEFTLAPQTGAVSPKRKELAPKAPQAASSQVEAIGEDPNRPSDSDLLYWSVGDQPDEGEIQ